MPGPLFGFLAGDHARLDGLLRRAMTEASTIDRRLCRVPGRPAEAYQPGGEILLPAAQRWQGGDPLPMAATLRLDHGALAALLVPTPTPAIIAAIRTVLTAHNPLEEGPGGVYERCERLAGAEADALLSQLHAAPEVPVAPYLTVRRS